jgi:hypothetical protein
MLPYYEGYGKYDLPDKLQDDLFDENGIKLQQINKLNKVNIFVGPNNSGKSLLMRELLRSGSKSYYSEMQWEEIQKALAIFDRIQKELRQACSVPDVEQFGDYSQGTLIDLAVLRDQKAQFSQYRADYSVEAVAEQLKVVFDRPFVFEQNKRYYFAQTNKVKTDFSHGNQALLEKVLECLNTLKADAVQVRKKLLLLKIHQEKSPVRMYVPAVRSLKPFSGMTQFENSTRQDYKFDSTIQIFTGQSFADAISKHKNNFDEFREKITRYESFLSETFFQHRPVVLTYHADLTILLIKIGNERDRPIYELGDGLQMIISLTWPFFTYASGTIAIEEPESFIHPGLQKEYMHFLSHHPSTKQFQIFLTTHSNHILDSINSSADISIFSVKKKGNVSFETTNGGAPSFAVENLAIGDENILRLLGVTSTSVYLSNCVVWVEGITDKMYLQRYIEQYLKRENIDEKYKQLSNLKEGINYSFSLTAGDSIVHFDFDEQSQYETGYSKIIVNKFCAKSFVIVDNDFGKNEPRKEAMGQLLGDRFVVLAVPEMENLLSPEVINAVIVSWPTVKRAVASRPISNLPASELENKKIGELIDTTILKDLGKVKKFAAPNGSLKPGDKYDFCKLALLQIIPTVFLPRRWLSLNKCWILSFG